MQTRVKSNNSMIGTYYIILQYKPGREAIRTFLLLEAPGTALISAENPGTMFNFAGITGTLVTFAEGIPGTNFAGRQELIGPEEGPGTPGCKLFWIGPVSFLGE